MAGLRDLLNKPSNGGIVPAQYVQDTQSSLPSAVPQQEDENYAVPQQSRLKQAFDRGLQGGLASTGETINYLGEEVGSQAIQDFGQQTTADAEAYQERLAPAPQVQDISNPGDLFNYITESAASGAGSFAAPVTAGAAAGVVGAILGAPLGLAVGTTALASQLAGESITNFEDRTGGRISPGDLALSTGTKTALEAFAPFKAAKALKKGFGFRDVPGFIGSTSANEGLTELGQGEVDRFAAAQRSDFEQFGEGTNLERANEAAAGAAAGGGLAAASSPVAAITTPSNYSADQFGDAKNTLGDMLNRAKEKVGRTRKNATFENPALDSEAESSKIRAMVAQGMQGNLNSDEQANTVLNQILNQYTTIGEGRFQNDGNAAAEEAARQLIAMRESRTEGDLGTGAETVEAAQEDLDTTVDDDTAEAISAAPRTTAPQGIFNSREQPFSDTDGELRDTLSALNKKEDGKNYEAVDLADYISEQSADTDGFFRENYDINELAENSLTKAELAVFNGRLADSKIKSKNIKDPTPALMRKLKVIREAVLDPEAGEQSVSAPALDTPIGNAISDSALSRDNSSHVELDLTIDGTKAKRKLNINRLVTDRLPKASSGTAGTSVSASIPNIRKAFIEGITDLSLGVDGVTGDIDLATLPPETVIYKRAKREVTFGEITENGFGAINNQIINSANTTLKSTQKELSRLRAQAAIKDTPTVRGKIKDQEAALDAAHGLAFGAASRALNISDGILNTALLKGKRSDAAASAVERARTRINDVTDARVADIDIQLEIADKAARTTLLKAKKDILSKTKAIIEGLDKNKGAIDEAAAIISTELAQAKKDTRKIERDYKDKKNATSEEDLSAAYEVEDEIVSRLAGILEGNTARVHLGKEEESGGTFDGNTDTGPVGPENDGSENLEVLTGADGPAGRDSTGLNTDTPYYSFATQRYLPASIASIARLVGVKPQNRLIDEQIDTETVVPLTNKKANTSPEATVRKATETKRSAANNKKVDLAFTYTVGSKTFTGFTQAIVAKNTTPFREFTRDKQAINTGKFTAEDKVLVLEAASPIIKRDGSFATGFTSVIDALNAGASIVTDSATLNSALIKDPLYKRDKKGVWVASKAKKTTAKKTTAKKTTAKKTTAKKTTRHPDNTKLSQWSTKLKLKHTPTAVDLDGLVIEARKHGANISGVMQGSTQAIVINPESANPIIYVDPKFTGRVRDKLLAHEFGHVVVSQTLNDMSNKSARAVLAEYTKWKHKVGNKHFKVAEILRSKKPSELMRIAITPSTKDAQLGDLDADVQEYLLDFEEWFADGVAKHIDSTSTTPVARFFRAIVAKLQEIFGLGSTGQTSVRAYLDSLYNRSGGWRTDAPAVHSVIRTSDPIVQGESGSIRSLIAKLMGVDPDVVVELWSKKDNVSVEDKLAWLASLSATERDGAIFNEAFAQSYDNMFTAVERSILGRAAMGTSIQTKMRSLLAASDQALVDLNSPDKATAYMYQLWAQGKLNVGPKARTFLQRIKKALEDILGIISDSDNSQKIFTAFNDGTIKARTYAGGKFVVERLKENSLAKKFGAAYNAALSPVIKAGFTIDSRMHNTGNPAIINIASTLHERVGNTSNVESYIRAKTSAMAKFEDQALRIYKDVDTATGQLALDSLYGVSPTTATTRPIVLSTRALFRKLFKYMEEAGIEMGDMGENFFPWVMDVEVMNADKAGFLEVVNRPVYEKARKGVAERINKSELYRQRANKDHDLTDAQIDSAARRAAAGEATLFPDLLAHDALGEHLFNNSTSEDGVVSVGLEGAKDRPAFRSMNQRLLDFIRKDQQGLQDMSKFFSRDLGSTVGVYIHQAAKRTEYARRFGTDGQKLEALLGEAKTRYGASDADIELARNGVHAAMGTYGRDTASFLHKLGIPMPIAGRPINPVVQKIMSTIMVVTNLAVLGLATLTSLTDPVGIAVRSGSMNSMFDGFKEVAKGKTRAELKELAETIGTVEYSLVNDALGWEYGGVYMSNTAKKINEGFFKITLLQWWTRQSRLIALSSGRGFLLKHAASNSDLSTRYLTELGLQASDVVSSAEGLKILTQTEIEQATPAELARDARVRDALNRFVDESILRPNSAQRPLWASDPHFMLVFHLKSFMYGFHDRIIRRMYHEAELGNWLPALFSLAFIPAFIAVDWLRDLIKHGSEGSPTKSNWGLWEYIEHSFYRAGLMGVAGTTAADIMRDREWGNSGVGAVAGPAPAWLLEGAKLKDILPGQSIGIYKE
jgi:hypothetical protein